jgi:rod shape determining protein RodA
MIGAARRAGPFDSPLDKPSSGLDWHLLAAAGALLAAGLAALHSIDHARGTTFAARQALHAAVGLPLMFGLARVRREAWIAAMPWLYLTNLALLASVFVFGKKTNAATRWIEVGPLQFQPSEVAKLLLIVTLAASFARMGPGVRPAAMLLRSILHAAPLVALVLMQPHLAGAVTLVVVWLAVSVAAGLPWRTVLVATAAAAAAGTAVWTAPGVIKPYMRDRIESKLNPDSRVGAYQQEQAMIALGVGGVSGVGYLRGERKASRYIPEQQNDFVFSVVGEEGGLVAGLGLMAAFGYFFFRVWLSGQRSGAWGRMVAAGVLAAVGFHVFVNLGMNLGVLPVAGLWLPFVSYGGTALWMCMGCLGLLLGAEAGS